jgi:hypothetical protein
VRVLLDENVPHALRNFLPRHEAVTAAYAGLAGLKNGALLRAAIEAGFDVLLTADKTLPYEQNLVGTGIAIVLLSANAWQLVKAHVQTIAAAVDAALPGTINRVDCGTFARRRSKPDASESGWTDRPKT